MSDKLKKSLLGIGAVLLLVVGAVLCPRLPQPWCNLCTIAATEGTKLINAASTPSAGGPLDEVSPPECPPGSKRAKRADVTGSFCCPSDRFIATTAQCLPPAADSGAP